MTTIEKLDRLAEFRTRRDLLEIDKQAAKERILTPEIKARLADIEAEFSGWTQTIDERIATLEAKIKAEVLTLGETVKGARLMAVWNKGRVTWDDKGLQGYMKAHPELVDFRKQGEPSISIRSIK